MIGVISLIIIVMWILFIFSMSMGDDYLIFISCCGLIVVSIYLMVNGLEGVDNWVTKSFAVIQIGIGFLGLLEPLLNIDYRDEFKNDDE